MMRLLNLLVFALMVVGVTSAYGYYFPTVPTPQYGGTVICTGNNATMAGYTIALDSIVSPAKPPDRAYMTISNIGSEMQNLESSAKTYEDPTNGKKLTLKIYGTNDATCLEFVASVQNPPVCSDNDGGFDIYTKGTQAANNVSTTDYCSSDSQVVEAWCSGDLGTTTKVTCPTNYVCAEGACVKKPEPKATNVTCVDSDGDDRNTKSAAVYSYDYNGAHYSFDYKDSCVSDTVISEATCSNSAPTYVQSTCPAGFGCTDGACVKKPVSAKPLKPKYGGDIVCTGGSVTDNGQTLLLSKIVPTSSSDNANAVIKTSPSGWNPTLKINGQENEFSSNDGNISTTISITLYTSGTDDCVEMVHKVKTAKLSSDQPPKPPSELPAETYTVELQKGWNLVSSPVQGTAKQTDIVNVADSTCTSPKFYVYDSAAKQYTTSGYSVAKGGVVPAQAAFWVKVSAPCKITFLGTSKVDYADGPKLTSGWAGIGAPYSKATWQDVAGSCQLSSGPWRFNTSAGKWEKAETLKAGEGYFVKVSGDCKLGEANSLPPTLPS